MTDAVARPYVVGIVVYRQQAFIAEHRIVVDAYSPSEAVYQGFYQFCALGGAALQGLEMHVLFVAPDVPASTSRWAELLAKFRLVRNQGFDLSGRRKA